ncbi:ATP-binding protein [Adlercreutzia shanghongiae]|uniref:ATP-binding protein n=1 Tax=Adlercreutzia shanghongiae TaxID=3111773 RepID=A0ABU6IXQ1_9ACTN|nr:ATP-binding protein [Adlercreutzia sp. R22]MEC4294455.1 ATP-binding protein [Adlercreutzia sp. R22]
MNEILSLDENMIQRPVYLERLTSLQDVDTVVVITGVRRCGKSTLLRMYEAWLLEQGIASEQIISINFESMMFDEMRDPVCLHRYIEERIDRQAFDQFYLLVDEAQEIEEWARAINSLRTSFPLKICVTGSNSRLFAGEGATYLSGRYVELKMYPLSLCEFERFRAVHPSSDLFPGETLYLESDESIFNAFMTDGSFPAVALAKSPEVVDALLSGIVDSVVTRDVMQRGGIENSSMFRRVAQFLFDNIGSEVSAHKVSSTLKSSGYSITANTVDRYINLMCDAFVLYRCSRYDIRGRERLRTNPKYYVVDPGLRNAFLGTRPRDYGHVLENLVFIELLRRGYEVTVGRIDGKEIDFIAVNHKGKVYVQVSQSLIDEGVRQREFAPLLDVRDAYPKYVLSLDPMDYSHDGIIHMSLREFLKGSPL